jgi:hypothetical protein
MSILSLARRPFCYSSYCFGRRRGLLFAVGVLAAFSCRMLLRRFGRVCLLIFFFILVKRPVLVCRFVYLIRAVNGRFFGSTRENVRVLVGGLFLLLLLLLILFYYYLV